MEAKELKEILAAYDAKLDKKLKINTESIRQMNLDKPKEKTRSILFSRSIEIVVFSLLALFLGNYIATHWQTGHFAISGIIVGTFTLIALAGSIGQVVLLKEIDYARPIVEIRKKIELVNTHGLLFIKLMFLSAPVWWAYVVVIGHQFFAIDVYSFLEADFVLKYVLVNALLILPLLWFLNALSFKNLHKTWVRKTIQFCTGAKTMKALEFLNDIETFKK